MGRDGRLSVVSSIPLEDSISLFSASPMTRPGLKGLDSLSVTLPCPSLLTLGYKCSLCVPLFPFFFSLLFFLPSSFDFYILLSLSFFCFFPIPFSPSSPFPSSFPSLTCLSLPYSFPVIFFPSLTSPFSQVLSLP